VSNQVHIGQQAFVRLDARPDQTFTGKMFKVAALPDSQDRWLNPGVKTYNIVVRFDEDQNLAGLKPGMTDQVELILETLDEALVVPVASVFTEQEKTYCWRMNGSTPEQVPVEVGRMNESFVQILSGLDEGDSVLLVEPSGRPSAAPANPVAGAAVKGR
jgi:HlyD family secretion protein